MTTVYFVRHAQPDLNNHDDLTRELSSKGMADRKLVTHYLWDKNVDVVLSSPCKRAADTVGQFAEERKLPVVILDGFRERKVGNTWIQDFDTFCREQWTDFHYRLSDGESLNEVQLRNISELTSVLRVYRDKCVVIGSHGTALSTIINYYNSGFGYEDFLRMKDKMPWIVKFTFEGEKCVYIEEIDLE